MMIRGIRVRRSGHKGRSGGGGEPTEGKWN